MLIMNFYRGCTDRLSGFVYDTEKKDYKEFSLSGKEWVENYMKDDYFFSRAKKEYKSPADIEYGFQTKADMEIKLNEIKRLGFKQNKTMSLDFGVYIA